MKLGSLLAGAGQVLQGVDAAEEQRMQALMKKIAHEQGLLGLESAKRKATTETQDFEADQAARAVPVATIPADPGLPLLDDLGNEIGRSGAREEGIDTPATLEAKAKALMRTNPNQAVMYQKAAKAMRDEGLTDLAKDIAMGIDPHEAVNKFNARGQAKIDPNTVRVEAGILKGKRDNGMDFVMDPRRVLGKPAERLTVLKPGDRAVASDGRTVAEGAAKPTAPARIDPLSPEGQEAKKNLETALAEIRKKHGVEKATTFERDLNLFIKSGKAKDLAEAIDLWKQGKTRDRASGIARYMELLKPPTYRGTPEQAATLRRQAEAMYDMGQDPKPKAAPSSEPKPKPTTASPPKPSGGTRPPAEGAQQAPDGKWYVQKPDGWYLVE